MYRSKIKPKARNECPYNIETSSKNSPVPVVEKKLTPENPVRKSLGVTQCRRIGLSRKKVTSSPNFGSQNENKTPTSSQEKWDNSSQEITNSNVAKKEHEKNENFSIKDTIKQLEQQDKTCSIESEKEEKVQKTTTSPKSSLTKNSVSKQQNIDSMVSKEEKLLTSGVKSKKKIVKSHPKSSSVKRTINELENENKTCKKYKSEDLQTIVSKNVLKNDLKNKKSEKDISNSQDDILIGFDSNLNSVTEKNLTQEVENNLINDRIESKFSSEKDDDIFSNIIDEFKETQKCIIKDSLISDKNKSSFSKIDTQKDSKISSSTKKVIQTTASKSSEIKNRTIALANNENIQNQQESVSTPKLEIKSKEKNSYFGDSDDDFQELTPVSRKIYTENKKIEKIDKIKKSSTKKNKEKNKNVENKKNNKAKKKNVEKPLSQISNNLPNINIGNSRKSFERNRSILTNDDDDDDDIFLPKKT